MSNPSMGVPLYFCVPKGTKSIFYYYSASGTHEVLNPAGEVAHKAEVFYPDGKVVTVPVPQGMHGRVWRLNEYVNIGSFISTMSKNIGQLHQMRCSCLAR